MGYRRDVSTPIRTAIRSVTLLASLLILALVVSQATTVSTAAVSIAASLIVLAVAARIVAGTAGSRVVTVGARAHEHREALASMPAPAHPDTAGRTRSRAPSVVAPAT